MDDLTHLDGRGRARMVDVGGKAITHRIAYARGAVRMAPATLARLVEGRLPKGDVLAVARIAAIQGAKKTADLIPLCHPLALSTVEVELWPADPGTSLEIGARVGCWGRTGVEMEALTAVTVAALAVYDMVKAVDRDVVISDIRLEEKSGGASGDWTRGR